LLPRITTGSLGALPRREQKVRLAKVLFSEEDPDDPESQNPSEVWQDNVDGQEDEAIKKKRKERLNEAKYALRLSSILREPACASMALSEISKRYLSCFGKEAAEAALRCANKAIQIASDGFFDNDVIVIEADDEPKIDPKYEENATTHGLSHPTSLKYVPVRVSQLCLRAAYLHQGNALAASGKDDQAREAYQKVLPLLENEPRCGRVDWERSSIFVNIGNTYSRQGEFAKANEQYEMAEKLAQDHLESEDGSKVDGLGMKLVANRARAFALKKAGKEDEAKTKLREVLELQKQYSEEQEKKKKEQEEAADTAAEQAQAQQQ
jgi:tetratricopeptide (TPR) repeat protein